MNLSMISVTTELMKLFLSTERRVAEQELMWNILNTVQHNVRKNTHKNITPKILHQPEKCVYQPELTLKIQLL